MRHHKSGSLNLVTLVPRSEDPASTVVPWTLARSTILPWILVPGTEDPARLQGAKPGGSKNLSFMFAKIVIFY